MLRIDLNCDMGESLGPWGIGADKEILEFVTSANIACGFHAGDPSTMRRSVRMALDRGVAVGAHPGLPDLAGFGRREMAITRDEAYAMTIYQVGALHGFVRSEGGVMHHVKPHGALYNMAARQRWLAEAIAEAVYRIDSGLILFGLAGSELIRAGEMRGLRVAGEAFADRSYEPDGSLTPRGRIGALVADPEEAAQRAVRIACEGKITAADGSTIPLEAGTICIHGDTPGAPLFARRIRQRLEEAGVALLPVGDG
jgi:UPF0271 protein